MSHTDAKTSKARERPGNVENLHSYVNYNKRGDKTVASYLHFTTLGPFKKFRFSFWVLEHYPLFKELCQGVTNPQVLQAIHDSNDREKDFPPSPQDVEKQYPKPKPLPKTAPKVDKEAYSRAMGLLSKYTLATIVYRLHKVIIAPPQLSDELKQARQSAALAAFKASTGLDIPSFDILTVTFPRVRARTDLGEHEMESYNRTLAIIKSLQYCTTASRFEDKFKSDKAYEDVSKIPASEIPPWMVAGWSSAGVTARVHVPVVQRSVLVPKKFELIWYPNSKNKYSQALLEHQQKLLEENFLDMPPAKALANKDPREYESGDEWRDTVRTQLRFGERRIDFVTFDAVSPETVVEGEQSHVKRQRILGPGELVPWSSVLQLLHSGVTIHFDYTLRPLHEDEDLEMEYAGLPLSLSEDIAVDEEGDLTLNTGTLHAAPHLSSDQSVNLAETKNPAGKDEQDTILENFMLGAAETIDREMPTPQKLYAPDMRDAMLQHYSNYDTWTTAGLIEWQRYMCDQVSGKQPTLSKEKVSKKLHDNTALSQDVIIELEAARLEGQQSALANDVEEADLAGRHYQLQAAFTGTQLQTGPQVEACRMAMKMKAVGHHGRAKELKTFTCLLLPRCTYTFLDTQINGAAFMLQRTHGYIPVAREWAEKSEVAAALEILKSVKTYGGIVADIPGLGKTATALLYMCLDALYATHVNEKGQVDHRPFLLLVPSGPVFNQWLQLITKHFNDLHLIISVGSRAPEPRFDRMWISSTAMQEAPHTLNRWPQHLKYVFDHQDPKASRTVILSTYDTHAERSIKTTFRKPKIGESHLVHWMESEKKFVVPVYSSHLENVLRAVILDEGHRARNPLTKLHQSVAQLRSPVHWFLTATPIINDNLDEIGPLAILWPAVDRAMKRDQAAMKWLKDVPNQQDKFSVLEKVKELPVDDIRVTAAMNPKIIESLLLSKNAIRIADLYPVMDDLIAIKRSTASSLTLNDHEKLSLRNMMPTHEVKTAELEYSDDEKPEAQHWHRVYARQFALIKTIERDEAAPRSKPGAPVPMSYRAAKAKQNAENNQFPPTTGPLRRLSINGASSLLSRFDATMVRLGYDTLVDDMAGYRSKGHGVEWFLSMVVRKGDPSEFPTRLDIVRYLTWASPKLRFVLSQIRDYVLPKKGETAKQKLLICEDIPLVAWYWELVLQYLHIDTAVMHAQLSEDKRQALVNEFNLPSSSLTVLIILYNVSAQGVNLDRACARVLVTCAAINASLEVQAWGRLIRVSQLAHVVVIRLKVLNSHDLYREAKQADKGIAEMATRAFSPNIAALLVKLLNENNQEVADAHNSVRNMNVDITQLGASSLEEDELEEAEEDVAGLSRHKRLEDLQYEKKGEFITYKRQTKKPRRLIDEMDVNYDEEDEEEAEEGKEEFEDADEEEFEEFEADEVVDMDEDDDEGSTYEDDLDRSDKLDLGQPLFTLESSTLQSLKKSYAKMTRLEQENYDQDEMNIRLLLLLNPNKVYEELDLRNPDILGRALRLLYRARFGQEHESQRLSPHINYTALSGKMAKTIANKVEVQRKAMKTLKIKLAGLKPSDRGTARTMNLIKQGLLPLKKSSPKDQQTDTKQKKGGDVKNKGKGKAGAEAASKPVTPKKRKSGEVDGGTRDQISPPRRVQKTKAKGGKAGANSGGGGRSSTGRKSK